MWSSSKRYNVSLYGETKHNAQVSRVRFNDIASVIKSKDIDALKVLLKMKHVELFNDKKHETLLHVAARLGDVDVIKTLLEDWRMARLLDTEMYNDDSPLVLAARGNHVAAVQVLADHGASVWGHKMQSGNTILHFAASLQEPELLDSLLGRNPPLKAINAKNKFGQTILDIALVQHSPNIQVLLQAGVDYSKPNKLTGRNVLHTCVAHEQCDVLRELLTIQKLCKFTNQTDRRGDTPLMLAVKVACLSCVQSLIKFMKFHEEFNKLTDESFLHMAVQTDRIEILSEVLLFSQDYVINYKDHEGRTPLLLAIECGKNNCLEGLISTQNAFEKNSMTGETALHTAVRVDNVEALNLLMENNNHVGTWCFSQQNRDGKTPFWMAVENNNAQFVAKAMKNRWVDLNRLNHHGDSCMYVAAACGSIRVLKVLLLSEKYYNYCRTYDIDIECNSAKLVKEAEISCDIYSSDIFILTDEIRPHGSHSSFPNSFLNSNKKDDRNIFHACALGGNAYCLEFIHILIKMFARRFLTLFDHPDVYGSTPLQLATLNDLGSPECVYYFLSNNVNISIRNKKGEYVLESILRNTEHLTDLLTCLLNEGISYDQQATGLQEESEIIKVDFSIIRPSERVTTVVRLFYDKLQSEQRYILLEHTLFKMYVYLLLARVNYFFLIRFILTCLSTSLLSAYIIFFCQISGEMKIVLYVRNSLRFLNVLSLLFSVPHLLYNEFNAVGILTVTLTVLPCLMVIGMTMIPHGTNLFFEVAAITILFAFFSSNMYSITILQDLSHQMAMLAQVVYRMITYCGTVIFIMWAFSIAFYCIFDNSYYFVTPFKSFIYTIGLLIHDETSDSFDFLEAKHFSQNKTAKGRRILYNDSVLSQLDLYLECALILAFIIMVSFALMNMLVSLAVQDSEMLERSGYIFRRHLKVLWLSNLEQFLDSSFYKLIKNTPLVYLFGIVPSKTVFDVPLIYYPMLSKQTQVIQEYVRELKNTLGKRYQGTEPTITFTKSTILHNRISKVSSFPT